MQLFIGVCWAISTASVFARPAPESFLEGREGSLGLLGQAPTVTISRPAATIVGSSSDGVDSFSAIPFAKPPVGPLRLKPPQPITAPLGTIQATSQAPSCANMGISVPLNLPESVQQLVSALPVAQATSQGQEDCLTLTINRPTGATSSSKYPVLVYIYGGGFEQGSSSMYSGSGWVSDSVSTKQPIVYVAMNYRLGGYGFLAGKEILKDGSSNLGLLDQRLALQWVADNIAQFGGDPSKVTIWGESAGAISVFDQMALYNGNHLYKGKALFRGAIMDSGSIVPANPVDGVKGQAVFDIVVKEAGCAGFADKLNCLRAVSFDTFNKAVNSVPATLSYQSVALSYLPRPDGKVLTQSPDLLIEKGKFAKVPFIIGDQEDEGTLFSLFQSNITTTDQLRTYLKTVFFPQTSDSAIQTLLDAYPDDPAQGSPFRTGQLNQLYPQFKRLAALLGDLTFTLSRRAFLDTANQVHPNVPSWSYLSSYFYGTPILGTLHGSDILTVFNNLPPSYPGSAFRAYYLSFINNLDPNKQTTFPSWPKWKTNKQLINVNTASISLIPDNFRQDAYDKVIPNTKQYYI